MPKPSTLQYYEQCINRVIDAVSTDPSRDFTLEALAEIAGLSPYHFHRIFNAMMGEPPAACIRRIRLLCAAMLLQFQPSSNVTHIAQESGFSSSQNFARAFRAWSGVSPTEFRACCRSNRLPPKLEQQKSKFRNAAPFVLEYLADLEGHTPRLIPNLDVLAKGENMNVEVKTLPAVRVAYARFIGSYADDGMTEVWGKIMKWGMTRGYMKLGGVSYGISRDNPELTDRCRYDACIPVLDDTTLDPGNPGDAGISIQTLEGGLYACYRRPVTRDQFTEAMNELFGIWLPQSGYECIGAPLEMYHDSQNNSCAPDALWDVSLCVPVRPLA